MPNRELFDAWRQADADASSAERDLKERFAAYERGEGPEPLPNQAMEVKLLRAAAMQLLDRYIRAAGEASTTGGGFGAP
jgi:hypothetical protein